MHREAGLPVQAPECHSPPWYLSTWAAYWKLPGLSQYDWVKDIQLLFSKCVLTIVPLHQQRAEVKTPYTWPIRQLRGSIRPAQSQWGSVRIVIPFCAWIALWGLSIIWGGFLGYQCLLAKIAVFHLHSQRQYASEHQLVGITGGWNAIVLRLCLWASQRHPVGCENRMLD